MLKCLLILHFVFKTADFFLLVFAFFFGRRRLKKRSEKTENARSKRKHRKGKGRGQAAEKKRSPLHLVWKRGRARSAKVHACGAQINQEFQEISRECEGSPKNKRHASRSPRSSFRKFCGQRPKDEKKGKIGKAAASVRDRWKKETKIMKKKERSLIDHEKRRKIEKCGERAESILPQTGL